MPRSKAVAIAIILTLSIVLLVTAYQLGQYRGRHAVYRTQAILAFGHYKLYSSIVDDLEKKCFAAALAEAKGFRDEQVVLFADNLRSTGNDPGVLAYVRSRDPELLKSVLSGHTPQSRPFSTDCSPPP